MPRRGDPLVTPVQAVIPVKPLGRALGRLAAVLTPSERRDLQQAMLTDLLVACRACPDLADVLVVSSDPAAGRLADTVGARVVPDHEPARGMNAAVSIGLQDAAARGLDALVLTADLPLVQPGDISAIIAAVPTVPGVVLVPSRDGTGTNALLLHPAQAMVTQLGPDSRARHNARIRDDGLAVAEVALPRVALDVDTPADLGVLVAAGVWCRTVAMCRERGFAERLAAGIAR